MITISGALLVAILAPQQADTTITVPAGTRLNLHTFAGEIVVETWDRNEFRIEADHGPGETVHVSRSGSVVEVAAEGRSRIPPRIDYRVTLPAATDLDLGGVNSDISVTGIGGQVQATTVNGDVRIEGGSGVIQVQTVQGDAMVTGARATVRAQSVSGSVLLRDIAGPVEAQTVSGSIVLDGIDTDDAEASAVSGSIFYDGEIRPGGRYSFVSHSGRTTLALPDPLDATISASVLSGRITSSFPEISAALEGSRRGTVVVGSGRASVEAETFSGEIRLVRRGEVRAPGRTNGTI